MKRMTQYVVRVINGRKKVVLTPSGRGVPVKIKRDPAAIASRFFDLDFTKGVPA